MTTHAEELSDAFGYLKRDEVALLKKYARLVYRQFASPVFVNFGAGVGTSGLALVEIGLEFTDIFPGPQIFTIDVSEESPIGGLQNERNAFKNAELSEALPEQILGCSWDVGKEWKEPCHLVFVDGDHSAESVEKDILAWKPHVVKGGYMLFHDYERDVWPDVQQVVDRMMGDWEMVERANALIVFRNNRKRAKKSVQK